MNPFHRVDKFASFQGVDDTASDKIGGETPSVQTAAVSPGDQSELVSVEEKLKHEETALRQRRVDHGKTHAIMAVL